MNASITIIIDPSTTVIALRATVTPAIFMVIRSITIVVATITIMPAAKTMMIQTGHAAGITCAEMFQTDVE